MKTSGKPARRRVGGHEYWMARALTLARRALGATRPNPPVGAVVVRRGRCVGEGYHHQAGKPHAEVLALRAAGDRARGATLYVTLEPCSTQGRTGPCTECIRASGIKQVVVSVSDPNPRHRGRGLGILRRSGIAVETGVCAKEGRDLLAPFEKWITTARPYVSLKMAMTLDGRIADAAGRSKWITGEKARRRVQKWRRAADAVMVGRGTACTDDPSLCCRTGSRTGRYRVIVDSTGALPLTARVLNDGRQPYTVVATTARCPDRRQSQYERKGARVWVLPATARGVSLPALMRRMGQEGWLHVLCEGGGELAAELVRHGCVDRYGFFVAPRLLGGGGTRPVLGGQGWRLKGAPPLRFASTERVGDDILINAFPSAPRPSKGKHCQPCLRA